MLKFVDITSETDIMVQVYLNYQKAIVNVNRIKPFRLQKFYSSIAVLRKMGRSFLPDEMVENLLSR
jgi:hypothetical protein